MTHTAWFFDMDGTLFDSMPAHAQAWEETMLRHGLHFTQQDCYLGEGRRGEDVIRECIEQQQHRTPSKEEIDRIYREKSERFMRFPQPPPIEGVANLLRYLIRHDKQLWIVTGSAQQSLFDRLELCFPSTFRREKMITASDVKHGKPLPDPYLAAWQRSGWKKEQCCVVENAPLGVQSAKAAGLFTIAVNTGPLDKQCMVEAGADQVFDSMTQLLHHLAQQN